MERAEEKHETLINIFFSRYATVKNRWIALFFISLGLAIVVIDNTVLNVSVPYILRDLHSSFSSIQWAISGYSLTIAAILIPIGRVGDIIGRKKIFLVGIIIFGIGSFLSSIATSAEFLIFGRAVVQAVGAAITLTSALAIVATEFQGKERAIAFGIWGAIVGVSATVGPLLGGYLTTFYSWRWSLRINVFIAIVAIIGSVFIRESKQHREKHFDWTGTILIGVGLFSLVFGFIQGRAYGWLRPNQPLSLFGLTWPSSSISVIPFIFTAALIILVVFGVYERNLERRNGDPVLKISLFRDRGFSVGLVTLLILSFSQFGIFFTLPIYMEVVLGYDALTTGIVFLSATITLFVVATLSGFIAERIRIKWIVVFGLIMLSLGTYLLIPSVSQSATGWTLAPALMVFGVGFGLSSAQLNNIVISSAPLSVAGEASATSITMRQIGFSIGIAVIGTLLASALIADVTTNIISDTTIPDSAKVSIIQDLQKIDIESGNFSIGTNVPSSISSAVRQDVEGALVDATQSSILTLSFFTVGVTVLTFFLPAVLKEEYQRQTNDPRQPQKKK